MTDNGLILSQLRKIMRYVILRIWQMSGLNIYISAALHLLVVFRCDSICRNAHVCLSVCLSFCHTFLSVMEFLLVTILHDEHDDQSEDMMTNQRT